MRGNYVMKFGGLEGTSIAGSELPPADVEVFLASYDPEANGGQGEMIWTTNREDAMTFESVKDAVALYRSVPKSAPIRLDGKPNRPLTAFTVMIEIDVPPPPVIMSWT